jgi:hypothetical protein
MQKTQSVPKLQKSNSGTDAIIRNQNLTESSAPKVRGSPGYAVFTPLEAPSA